MALFTKIVKERGYNGHLQEVQRTNTLGKIAIALGIIGSSYLLFADSKMDIEGDMPRSVSSEQAIATATERYNEVFSTLSAAEKFSVQYGGGAVITIGGEKHGNSFLSFFNGHQKYHVTINNKCLGDSAYDINGGSINLQFDSWGLFSHTHLSANGDTPTAVAQAEIDKQNPDELHVTSAIGKLKFYGLESGKALRPADNDTQNVLNTYGCQMGYQTWVEDSVSDTQTT